ncbi:hypothetical protein ACPV5G_16080 [Photobacterium damselae]|uniref:hypothetical protein n=1 Tax=Photobacterium damselae TaxID=38293 RepID=UPI0040675F68
MRPIFALICAIFFVFSLVFSLPSLACTATEQGSIPHYDEHCPIEMVSIEAPRFLVQIKFSKKPHTQVIQELNKVKALGYPVAIQTIKEGFRLFVGPIQPKQLAAVSTKLAQLGYKSVMLKSVPDTPVAANSKLDRDQLAPEKTLSPPSIEAPQPLPAVKGEPQPQEVSYHVLGQIEGRVFYAPLVSPTQFQRLSFVEAYFSCAESGIDARIATQDEYIKLMASKVVIGEVADNLAVPFWLNAARSITRVNNKIEIRRAHAQTHYGVICSASN